MKFRPSFITGTLVPNKSPASRVAVSPPRLTITRASQNSTRPLATASLHNLYLKRSSNPHNQTITHTLTIRDPETLRSGNIVYARLIFHGSDHSNQHE
jgi:hypothetical protein